jgi:ribonuclease P protein component
MENSREADISTEQSGAQAPPRFPFPDEDRRGPPCAGTTPCARPEEAERLSGDERGYLRVYPNTGIGRPMTTTAGATSPETGDRNAPSIARLPRRADFLRIAAARNKWAAPGLVLQAAPRPDEAVVGENALRVGFTATRKIGGAVVRNRARRRLRAAAAQVLPRMARHDLDYVLIARATTAARPFDALVSDLEAALMRCGGTGRGSDAS